MHACTGINSTNLQQTHGCQQAFLVAHLCKRCPQRKITIGNNDLKWNFQVIIYHIYQKHLYFLCWWICNMQQ